MKISNNLLLTIFITFAACSNHEVKKDAHLESPDKSSAGISTDNVRPLLDTSILLSGAKYTTISSSPIRETEAVSTLYKYFAKKGVVARTQAVFSDVVDSSQKSVVNYDTLYQLRTERFSGAVIEYHIGPPDLNGHCFQPSKAIILYTKNGLRITDEGFIPTNFSIDSVSISTIYGYDYECGGRGVIRNFRIKLR